MLYRHFYQSTFIDLHQMSDNCNHSPRYPLSIFHFSFSLSLFPPLFFSFPPHRTSDCLRCSNYHRFTELYPRSQNINHTLHQLEFSFLAKFAFFFLNACLDYKSFIYFIYFFNIYVTLIFKNFHAIIFFFILQHKKKLLPMIFLFFVPLSPLLPSL